MIYSVHDFAKPGPLPRWKSGVLVRPQRCPLKKKAAGSLQPPFLKE
jgi:hypothetical protein